jgi:hypothetical protein
VPNAPTHAWQPGPEVASSPKSPDPARARLFAVTFVIVLTWGRAQGRGSHPYAPYRCRRDRATTITRNSGAPFAVITDRMSPFDELVQALAARES